jgi:acetylornithine deacetylase/succinyl-diaminopimelate desuccinylase-like protein
MDDLATVADMVKAWGRPIEEREGRLIGPGTNSSATCASLLGLARLFTLSGVRLSGKVYLVGVVQEETGLTGVKRFLKEHPEIDYLVEVSGGLGRISYGALGIHWFKVHFRGPRAHTLRGPGPNVTKGVARSVTRVFSIPLPENTFLNVSMLGAGKVYNHRSDDGWHSVDLRSIDNDVLDGLKEEILSIAAEVAEEEELEWWIESYSESPAGQLPGARDSRLVRVTEEATRLLGVEPTLSNRGSSNMNAGIATGISSISAGGDRGGGSDTPEEYANIEPVLAGVKMHFVIGYTLLSGAKGLP